MNNKQACSGTLYLRCDAYSLSASRLGFTPIPLRLPYASTFNTNNETIANSKHPRAHVYCTPSHGHNVNITPYMYICMIMRRFHALFKFFFNFNLCCAIAKTVFVQSSEIRVLKNDPIDCMFCCMCVRRWCPHAPLCIVCLVVVLLSYPG